MEVSYAPMYMLKPYENNAKKHPREQIEQIKKSIQDYGFNDPVGVWTNSDGDLEVVEGHGRVIAAEELGYAMLPVINLDHLSDEQRREYCLVHNKLTMNSDYDKDILDIELDSLNNFDAEFFGFDVSIDIEEEEKYTSAVDTPIYEPSDRDVDVNELYDDEKYKELIKKIDGSNLSEDVKAFYRLAAARFVEIDFRDTADWYVNQSDEAKEIAEELALVIVDYGKALELGFIKLNNEFAEMFGDD